MDAKNLSKDVISVTLSLELKGNSPLKVTTGQIKSELSQIGEVLKDLKTQSPADPSVRSQLSIERSLPQKSDLPYQDSISKLNEILEIMGDGEPNEPKEIVSEVRRQLNLISKIEGKLAQLLNASSELKRLSNSSAENRINKIITETTNSLAKFAQINAAVEEFTKALPNNSLELPQLTSQLLHYMVHLRKLSKYARKSLYRNTTGSLQTRAVRQALINFERQTKPTLRELLDSALNENTHGENIFIRSFLQQHEGSYLFAANNKREQLVQKILEKLNKFTSEKEEAEEGQQLSEEVPQHLVPNKLGTKLGNTRLRQKASTRSGKFYNSSFKNNNSKINLGVSSDTNQQSEHAAVDTKLTQNQNNKLNEFVNLVLHCISSKSFEPEENKKVTAEKEPSNKKNNSKKSSHHLEFSINMENLGLLAVSIIHQESKIDLKFASEKRSVVNFIEKRLYTISNAMRAIGFETVGCASDTGTPKMPAVERLV